MDEAISSVRTRQFGVNCQGNAHIVILCFCWFTSWLTPVINPCISFVFMLITCMYDTQCCLESSCSLPESHCLEQYSWMHCTHTLRATYMYMSTLIAFECETSGYNYLFGFYTLNAVNTCICPRYCTFSMSLNQMKLHLHWLANQSTNAWMRRNDHRDVSCENYITVFTICYTCRHLQ